MAAFRTLKCCPEAEYTSLSVCNDCKLCSVCTFYNRSIFSALCSENCTNYIAASNENMQICSKWDMF